MDKIGRTPLIKALIKHKKLMAAPFHMPGHKKGTGIGRSFARLMKTDPFSLDMTELPGLDDLHNPCGPIREAQIKAAELFGARQTFFLVNGTSAGIHAAVMSVCRPNDVILMPRDVHRSVIGACILSGARPAYLPVRINREYSIPLPPRPQDVRAALEEAGRTGAGQAGTGQTGAGQARAVQAGAGQVKAVLMVHPSYYGVAGQLEEIAAAAHTRQIPLIVDEAHGAHFAFSDKFPVPALKQGADISIQSTHKTLGALTQASMLHVNSDLVDGAEVFRHLKVLQSTSPSYLLMASLDSVVGQMEKSGKNLVARSLKLANFVRSNIRRIPGLKCLDETVLGSEGGSGIVDPTKIYISVRGIGLTGYQAADLLLRKYKIQVELSDRYNVLCMLSIGNTVDDAKNLVWALKELASVKRTPLQPTQQYDFEYAPLVTLTPREAWYAPKKTIPLREAVGQVAAEMIAPYPPGIPLVCPGEEITREIVDLILSLKSDSCSFHGPADRSLETVSVVNI